MFGERSSRTGDVGDPDIGELNRRVANLIRIGTIAEADYGRALARVRIGDLLTDWRPWLAPRVGGDIAWWPPEVGEQAILFSPSGELTQGVILAGLYRQAKPAPADTADIKRTLFKDGAVMEYDRAAHRWRLSVPAGGKILLEIGPTRLELTDRGARITAPRIDLN